MLEGWRFGSSCMVDGWRFGSSCMPGARAHGRPRGGSHAGTCARPRELCKSGAMLSLRRRAGAGLAILVLGLLAVGQAPPASAATPDFSAHGSAGQVYVTGLASNASMSLLNSGGTVLDTQNADSLGGLLFRNVPPGTGYRVRRR